MAQQQHPLALGPLVEQGDCPHGCTEVALGEEIVFQYASKDENQNVQVCGLQQCRALNLNTLARHAVARQLSPADYAQVPTSDIGLITRAAGDDYSTLAAPSRPSETERTKWFTTLVNACGPAIMIMTVSPQSSSNMGSLKALSHSRLISNAPDPKEESQNNGLHISESCIKRLKEIANDGRHLRITVDGGGCSGFQYKFDLDKNINEDDIVFSKDGTQVVIDEISLNYVRGSTVEYHEELIRSAFRIVDNPLAEQGCSCGASFSIKID